MFHYLIAARQFLSDPRLWKLVVLCFLISCAAFAALWAGLGWGLDHLAAKVGWFQSTLKWGAWAGSFIISLILFPALFSLVGGLFYEAIADAVDARHFPHLPPANGVPLMASLLSGFKYFILLLVLNAVALPLYFTLLWVLGAGAGLFIVVNGVLFGREQYDAVALRRYAPKEARTWRRAHRFRLFCHGSITALLSLIPFVNFLAPLLGIAAMTHLVNRSIPRRGAQGSILS